MTLLLILPIKQAVTSTRILLVRHLHIRRWEIYLTKIQRFSEGFSNSMKVKLHLIPPTTKKKEAHGLVFLSKFGGNTFLIWVCYLDYFLSDPKNY